MRSDHEEDWQDILQHMEYSKQFLAVMSSSRCDDVTKFMCLLVCVFVVIFRCVSTSILYKFTDSRTDLRTDSLTHGHLAHNKIPQL